MLTRWKTFSHECKRRYLSIFEERKVADIQDDYYSGKWISKGDLQKMYEFEKESLINAYTEIQSEMRDLKDSFNLNAFSNYSKLENIERQRLSQSFKPKR